MSASPLPANNLEQAMPFTPGDKPQAGAPRGQEPTSDDPNQRTPEQNAAAVELPEYLQQELLKLRRTFKLRWAPIRRNNVRRVLKAFEFLKNNIYGSFDPENFDFYDPLNSMTSGAIEPEDVDLYKFNNNVYGMLALSFMAALSAQVPKARYMPNDADSQVDISTARRASTMMAMIERDNKIKSKQKLELLHLWTGGCYFSYTRYVVDANRFDSTKQPVWGLVDQEVMPERYECPQCGASTPTASIHPMTSPRCANCGAPLDEEHVYPSVVMPAPKQIGTEKIPNGQTLIDVFGTLNVDADPHADELWQSPIVDLEMEVHTGSIRAAYPKAWEKLRTVGNSTGSPDGEADRMMRFRLYSSNAARSGYLTESMPTFSRCWFQAWAFDEIDNQDYATQLKKLFPEGVKLVSAGAMVFLEAVPERLTEKWTWCPSFRGVGIYPPGVGDAALDIQERINDVANIVHEHMDRNASPTILGDADALDGEALEGKLMLPGTFTMVKRKGALAAKPLSDLLYQPTFHVDAQIYSYGENLIMLAQLVSGVQPQIFGGSDPNVKTASGQQQMLNTALGRLGLFWDQMREEHADRSKLAVKCMAMNMDDQLRVVVDGDTDSGYKNEFILLTEVQGDFHAYPESDQGFPATYAEIRDRLMEILEQAETPFVQAFLSEPDNLRLLATYILPPDTVIPGDAERARVKRILAQLAKEQPQMVPNSVTGTPMMMPSIEPEPDFDDFEIIITMTKIWCQKNYEMMDTEPLGFQNVLAFLRLCSQLNAENQAMPAVQQKLLEAKAVAQHMAASGAAPPQPGGAPSAQPPQGQPN